MSTSVSFINTLPKMSKYIKEIEINEPSPTVFGLIDTGCDICFIKFSVADNINLMVRPASKELTVYSNIKSNVVCGVTK